MSIQDRRELFKQIENARNSKVLLYVTSDRQGMETQIAEDATGHFVEHLDKIGVVDKITLILYTNGGNTLSAWNIVNLIRQFCEDFEVIVPVRARSAGTLMCLGANRIVMTKQATLGPIDPSVNTPLNPEIVGAGPHARVPVSVEAIKGYLELAKHELSIKDDIALASIFSDLSNKVHPLVLGEVYRAIGQIQMLAEKLLVNQVNDADKVQKIISFLCSESGSHDYTINRREAQNNLGLCIEKPNDTLYNLIKSTYNSFKEDMELGIQFDPNTYLGAKNQVPYVAYRGLIESVAGGTDAFTTNGNLTRVNISTGNGQQIAINDQRTFEGWKHYEHDQH